MKKYAGIRFLLALAVVGSAMSCSKSYNAGNKSLNQLFSGIRPASQQLTVIAGQDALVYGTLGTKLHFYANSFKDANGNIITGGTVNLQLTEMYTTADYIENRTSTVSGDALLTSGGEINLIATLNGQRVYANSYGITFARTNLSSDTMQLYYGSTNTSDSVVTWTAGSNTNAGTKSVNADTVYGKAYYVFDSCTGFDMINCDYYYNWNLADAKTVVTAHVTGSDFDYTNTEVVIAIPSKNVAVFMSYNYALKCFVTPQIVPVGESYDVVSITNNNGSWYYSKQTGVISNNLSLTVTPVADTRANIVSELEAL